MGSVMGRMGRGRDVQEAITRVQTLEADGRLTGVMDDRGKVRCCISPSRLVRLQLQHVFCGGFCWGLSTCAHATRSGSGQAQVILAFCASSIDVNIRHFGDQKIPNRLSRGRALPCAHMH